MFYKFTKLMAVRGRTEHQNCRGCAASNE